MNEFTQIFTAATATFTIGGGLVGLGWWLSGQFRHLREEILSKIDAAESALETKYLAHEKLDDERFNNINLKMLSFELREQNAGKIKSPYDI